MTKEGKTIFDYVVEYLQSDKCTFEAKDLLLCKLEYASSFNDAYLTDEEKEIVNSVMKSKGIKFQIK